MTHCMLFHHAKVLLKVFPILFKIVLTYCALSTCIFFCRGREGIQGQKGEAGRDGSPGLDGRAGLPGPPGPPGFMNGYDVSGNLNEEVK